MDCPVPRQNGHRRKKKPPRLATPGGGSGVALLAGAKAAFTSAQKQLSDVAEAAQVLTRPLATARALQDQRGTFASPIQRKRFKKPRRRWRVSMLGYSPSARAQWDSRSFLSPSLFADRARRSIVLLLGGYGLVVGVDGIGLEQLTRLRPHCGAFKLFEPRGEWIFVANIVLNFGAVLPVLPVAVT